jgi:hypothetical protein
MRERNAIQSQKRYHHVLINTVKNKILATPNGKGNVKQLDLSDIAVRSQSMRLICAVGKISQKSKNLNRSKVFFYFSGKERN